MYIFSTLKNQGWKNPDKDLFFYQIYFFTSFIILEYESLSTCVQQVILQKQCSSWDEWEVKIQQQDNVDVKN